VTRCRHATAGDLRRVAEIWYEAAIDGPNPPALTYVPSLYEHQLETNELFVLERGHDILAFAALLNRDTIAFLADLFVDGGQRSAGLGRRLLEHVLPTDGRTRWTVSSNDPRALPLYIRFGMLPRWPYVVLRADLPALRPLGSNDVEVIRASVDDIDFARSDAELSGRNRPVDLAYWVQRRGGVPMWFVRGQRVVGYGLAQTRSDDVLRQPDTITLGPMGALARADSVACVLAAVAWARDNGAAARISLLGPHPALPVLLEVGFRIAGAETFCSSAPPVVDAERYVPSGGDLF
jgi:GNAT superfamily N-acetyltransferase